MNEFLTPKSFLRFFLFSIYYFSSISLTYSQSVLDINPYRYSNPDKSIQSSSFVDESTGRATFTISLGEAKTNSLQQPITLTYTSNGFNANDKYSTYGKGWSLNYGPVITRDINYFADEQDKTKYHDRSNPTPLTDKSLSLFYNAYNADFRTTFDLNVALNAEYFYNTFIKTDKVDLEVDYFYYNINGFKNMFSVLEYINNPSYTHVSGISDKDINRLYLDHKFIDIARKKSNSAFVIKSQGVKYSFIGGDKIWKRTREFNYTSGSNTQIDWNNKNIATGFTNYNPESIEPDNDNGVNEKISFNYQTLPIITKTIESFHFKSNTFEYGQSLNWSIFKAQNDGIFFGDFRDDCMNTCMHDLSPKDPSYNIVFNNCLSNCNAIAAQQDANNKMDWRNAAQQNPEIIREEKKLITSVTSKEYDIEFSYIYLDNDSNNTVLNELLVYQKSSNNRLLVSKYKFSYINYSTTVNLLKEVSKYTGNDILIDRYKFDYYDENLLSTYNVRNFSVNVHNNFVVSSNTLESAQTAELKEVLLADGGSVQYNYINEPNNEGVIVSNLKLKSGKDILNYQFNYANSVPNYSIAQKELLFATVAEDCDKYNNPPSRVIAYASNLNTYKEVERPYRPSYFKNIEITLPNGSKTKKVYDLYSSQITLVKEELFSPTKMVKETDYNYERETITKDSNGDDIRGDFYFVGYQLFVAADFENYGIIEGNTIDGTPCGEAQYYKSIDGSHLHKDTNIYYLKSINTKEFTSTNPIENSINYEYDLTNINFKFPLKVKTTDSKGRVNSTNFIYDTKYWKPLQELNYSESVLLSKSEKKYDNLGQMKSEKIRSYKDNQETLLSDMVYTYQNGRINSANDKLTGSIKKYVSSYDGFTPLYELEFLSDESDFVYNNSANLQLDYNNPQAYFSSLVEVYGQHFKKGYIYNPHGVYKIFDANKKSVTFLYDAAGRVVKKLDHKGNLLESNNYYSKNLGTIPQSIYNETLYGNYNWNVNYEDCYNTADNSSYNLGCLSSNNTGTYNIKLHFNGNVYDFTCSDYEYILDAASNVGINIPILNGVGVDGANLSRLKYGKVDQADQMFLGDCKIANGYILLESARPLCDCEIFFVGN